MNVSCLTLGTCPNAIAAGVKLPYTGFTGKSTRPFGLFPSTVTSTRKITLLVPIARATPLITPCNCRVDKRFASGLSFLVSYTVSKNLTDADSAGPGVAGFIGTNEFIGQNSYNRPAEKAVSELDIPQSLVASFFYELPLGHGKRYLNGNGAVDRVVGGWYVSGVAQYKSGTPTEVYGPCGGTAGDVLFAGCHFTGSARVNVVPGVSQTNKGNFNPFTTPFWNPAAFSRRSSFDIWRRTAVPCLCPGVRIPGRRLHARQENQDLR